MLTQLQIRDLAVIEAVTLDFGGGFTVLTGETGAGKSILIDALALALGERGDAGAVRAGASAIHRSSKCACSARRWRRGRDSRTTMRALRSA